jgi:hypothetical protein
MAKPDKPRQGCLRLVSVVRAEIRIAQSFANDEGIVTCPPQPVNRAGGKVKPLLSLCRMHLFDRHTLRQVTRLIDIRAAPDSDVIRQ